MSSHTQAIRDQVVRSAPDPDRFNTVVLGRGPYWSRQKEICRSVLKYRTTCVYSGNNIGKSYLLAGLIAWAGSTHPGSKTIVAAPTQDQLAGVAWAELTSAYNHSRVPLGGKLKSLAWELGDNWSVEGYGSGSVESKSGRHARDLFAFIDESSGVNHQVQEAIDSLNARIIVHFGNPIRPLGKFHDLCNQQGNRHVNAIQISSLESPHATWDRSEWGMADRTWLESVADEYGEDSLWYRVHVLGLFPDSAADALIPREWLDLALQTLYVPSGPRRIAVDLAKGNGGNRSVILCRDDRGILDLDHSRSWSLEETAKRVRILSDDRGVAPGRISYDAAGLGADFGNRLAALGLHGCKGFMGSHPGGDQFANLRAACHWAMRRRLDPRRSRPATKQPPMARRPSGIMIPRSTLRDGLDAARDARAPGTAPAVYTEQPPFSIRTAHMALLRPELQALQYELDDLGRITMGDKEELEKLLKQSPDFSDTFAQSFAFPNS